MKSTPTTPLFLLLIVVFFFASCSSKKELDQVYPNIVILLADDLGYGDLGCYGGIANTPHLDQLAKEGIRFTDFYSAAPNCSPARAGLITGRSPSKIGVFNYIPAYHPMHLRGEETTIAEIVKSKNYDTGHFGKWHLSTLADTAGLNQAQPHEQGFDYSLGTTNNAQPSHLNPINFVRNGKEMGEMQGYSCDIVVEEATQWLAQRKNQNNPFLLYMAFHEPHRKVASPPELTAKYSQYGKQHDEYLANVENMDQAIGKLIASFDESQIRKNTLILFASDNGSYRNGSNGPLLGGKSFVYEGGIRVPGILNWKGKIESNQTVSEPACLIDMMPTICELTGANHPKPDLLDGTSLVPLLSQKPLERTKPLSWFFYRTTPEIAMRIGNYIILGQDSDTTRHTHPSSAPDMEHIKNLTLENFELYDLKNDVGQENNIDYTTLDLGKQYKNQLVTRLKEIQQAGHYWDNLPPATRRKRLKSEWRQLRPSGFGN